MMRYMTILRRSIALAATTATLAAAGLAPMLPSGSQAAERHSASRPAATSRVPGSLGRAAGVRPIAADIPAAGFAGTAQLNTDARTGVLTGVVRSMTGKPFAGACVTAAGEAGGASAETTADGRYLLSGLRPGRYALRVVPCPAAGAAARGAGAVGLWPGLPALVAVRAGRIATLPPVTIAQRNRARPELVPASASARSKTGSISGLVTGHGRPLRGICVEADPVNGGFIGQATTSKTGRYRISHLPRGPYQVGFADQACNTGAVNWLSQWYPGINTPFGPQGTQLNVRAGQGIGGIDGKLKLGSELAGMARSRSGRRLRGICVNVTAIFPPTGLNGQIDTFFITNNGGFFSGHGLFPGQYTLLFTIGCGSTGNYAFQWWNGATSQSRATLIHITGRQIIRNIDPVLGPGAAVTGTVRGRSAAGPPLSGVCVYANDSDGIGADAITGPGGHYRLDGLAGARYQITFDPTCGMPPSPINYVGRTRSITVTAGKAISGFNADLVPGAILSGKVTNTSGRPLGSVCVQVDDPDGDLTMTDTNGAYSIIGIPPGSYSVGFFGGCGNTGSLAPQSYNDQSDPFAANQVSFKSGKTTTNIDAVMRPGGTVAGVVTGAAGRGLDGICVAAGTESQFASGDVADVEETFRGGRYFLRNLAPGPYQIEFNCDGGNRYTSPWFKAQPDSTTAELLSVNPGVITTLNTTLGLAGSIAGTVTSRTGHPLHGVCVGVDNARKVSLPDYFGLSGDTATAAPGRYEIDGLMPGRYLVQFSPCLGKPRYASQWYRNKATAVFATPVTVKAGRATSGVNAALPVGGSISGLVTGPTGKPLRRICVEALDAPAQTSSSAQTNRQGRYAFTGLATGRYSLSFAPCQQRRPNLGSVSRPGMVTVIAPKTVTGVDVKLEPGGSVSGKVTSAAPPSPLGSGICVLLLPVDPNNGDGLAFTRDNGRYLASDLAPGKYQAYFNDPFCSAAAGPAPQWYNGQPTEARAASITVAAGHTTTGIDAALKPYGGITGTVTNQARAGVSGECVTAIPVAPRVDPFGGILQAAEVAVTTSSGRYALADLPPGRYKAEFTVGCGATGYATQWWDNATSGRSAKVITVGFATVGGIDAALRR